MFLRTLIALVAVPEWIDRSLVLWIAGIVALCWILGPVVHWLTHPAWDEDVSRPEALRSIEKAPPKIQRVARGVRADGSHARATAPVISINRGPVQVNVRAKAMGIDPRFGG
jgi:hypothetical protein